MFHNYSFHCFIAAIIAKLRLQNYMVLICLYWLCFTSIKIKSELIYVENWRLSKNVFLLSYLMSTKKKNQCPEKSLCERSNSAKRLFILPKISPTPKLDLCSSNIFSCVGIDLKASLDDTDPGLSDVSRNAR